MDLDQEREQIAERLPSPEGPRFADQGWICGQTNLSSAFAGTDTDHTDSATAIGERSAHNAVGHAHPEDCLTGTTAGSSSNGAAETAWGIGWETCIYVPTDVF